jgi:DNA invertase Pin-like site-specific DNA recombinase
MIVTVFSAGRVSTILHFWSGPRTMKYSAGVHLIERINKRGALIKVLDKPHVDLTTSIGRGFIAFLSALAEDERQRIVKRAGDGRRAAKARGARFGRKPKLDTHQQHEARQRLAARLRDRTDARRVSALYVPADPLVNSNRLRINALALSAHLPTMFGFQEYVAAGGL